MGGKASRVKKQKVEQVNDTANSLTRGQLIHPLLIPHVADNIFSNLGGRDLLSVRRVCMEWFIPATEVYRKREDIVKTLILDQCCILRFIDLMAFSQKIPVVRWFIDQLHPPDVPAAAFLKFITFIAPSVRSLKLAFASSPPGGLETEVQDLALLLFKLDPKSLRMPELEMLEVKEYFSLSPRQDVGPLTCKIVQLAEGLQTFCSDFPMEKGREVILQALPKGLRRLDFKSRFPGNLGDSLYSVLLDSSGFHLKELKDATHCHSFDGGALVKFLSAHKDSLVRIDVDKLEKIYKETYPSFPQLKFVEKLGCYASWNSTFEFLTSFPNVVELTIHPKEVTSRISRKEEGDWNYLPQHRSVRKLHIYLKKEDLINFDVLGHCFPDVTHLAAPVGRRSEGLTDIFTHFPNLEWLYIVLSYNEMTPAEWQQLWSCISGEVCYAMSATGNYEDEVVQGIGPTNLKRLRTLEVNAFRTNGLRGMFTGPTFRRVFERMESLKEICFGKDLGIPQGCLPFVEPLRAKGIDLYIMKRRADWLQD